jgi:hypothetical protein
MAATDKRAGIKNAFFMNSSLFSLVTVEVPVGSCLVARFHCWPWVALPQLEEL